MGGEPGQLGELGSLKGTGAVTVRWPASGKRNKAEGEVELAKVACASVARKVVSWAREGGYLGGKRRGNHRGSSPEGVKGQKKRKEDSRRRRADDNDEGWSSRANERGDVATGA